MDIQWQELQTIQGDVIVIEDDPTLRALMVDIVEQLNAHCVAFDTADDALIYMLQADRAFALLIADHGVPGTIQGTELSAMVQQKWPDVGVILTSGYLLEPSTLPPNVVYLLKPWSLDGLVTAIAGLVQPGVALHKTAG
ncbi:MULTISPECIES: response regulator [Pseudomonas]|uniref:Response regulator n=1 Tax=Pseudomonas eucalypticola TaxID=2599595 RepID=A0A7D5D6T4_9PSED|nr:MULTISPECIES: response regulator [Pseudomonas]QKZ04819.1 response regulator [Pseudomonas eucalypticola]